MQWYNIVVKDMKIMLRDRVAWLVMLLVPLVVLIIAGFALSGVFSSSVPELKLAYSYSGDVNNIEALMHSLESIDTIELTHVNSKEEGLELIKNSTVTALMSIPNDFTTSDLTKTYIIDFYYDIGNQSTADVLKGMVQGVVKGVNDSLVSTQLLVNQAIKYKGSIEEDELSQIVGTVREALHEEVRVDMSSHGVGGEENMKSFYQVIPGFAVMFLLFSILGGANKIIEERQNKTLRRILVAPIQKKDVIIGKWAGMTIQGFCQAIVMFGAAKLIFHISLGSNIFNLLVFLFIIAAVAGAIGICIASIVKSFSQANGVAMLLFMGMSALGGSWWPLEVTPSFMQTIGKFTLNYWAITGIRKLILFNQPLTSLILEISVLALIGIVFIFLAFKNFDFE